MLTFARIWLALLAIFAGPLALAAPSDTRPVVRLAASAWPPFADEALPAQGSSTAILRQALARAGYRLEVVWLPWTRAVRDGVNAQTGLDGYFPEYATADTRRRCQLSAPIGSSVLGLAHRKDYPLQWRTIADLQPLRVGVVNGYANSDAFDDAVRRGQLHVDVASDDISNVRKLLRARIDVAVIDYAVMRYLLTHPSLRTHADQVAFHPRELAEQAVRVCFGHGARLQPVLAALDAHALTPAQLRQQQTHYQQQLTRAAPATATR